MTELESSVLSLGDDLESPFAVLQVLLDTEEEKRRKNLRSDFRNLGMTITNLLLKRLPITDKIRGKSNSLDAAIVKTSVEQRTECMAAFANGLGIAVNPFNEGVSQDRYDYLSMLYSKGDPATRLFDSIRGEDKTTPAACLFLQGRMIFYGKDRARSLEIYLLDANQSGRIRDRVLIGEAEEIMVCVSALIPVYSEWMATGQTK